MPQLATAACLPACLTVTVTVTPHGAARRGATLTLHGTSTSTDGDGDGGDATGGGADGLQPFVHMASAGYPCLNCCDGGDGTL
jgi:hypothetical protein